MATDAWGSGGAGPAPSAAVAGDSTVPGGADAPRFSCPYCHTDSIPRVERRVSTAGWVVLVILVFFCLPLFWIGLLIREDQRLCRVCGMKLG